ncbi:hypothetical protein SNEBB_002382 [Seison nebaliae]|nr:hypothetical protein SNEBB_002382 [Seison nebaliae]
MNAIKSHESQEKNKTSERYKVIGVDDIVPYEMNADNKYHVTYKNKEINRKVATYKNMNKQYRYHIPSPFLVSSNDDVGLLNKIRLRNNKKLINKQINESIKKKSFNNFNDHISSLNTSTTTTSSLISSSTPLFSKVPLSFSCLRINEVHRRRMGKKKKKKTQHKYKKNNKLFLTSSSSSSLSLVQSTSVSMPLNNQLDHHNNNWIYSTKSNSMSNHDGHFVNRVEKVLSEKSYDFLYDEHRRKLKSAPHYHRNFLKENVYTNSNDDSCPNQIFSSSTSSSLFPFSICSSILTRPSSSSSSSILTSSSSSSVATTTVTTSIIDVLSSFSRCDSYKKPSKNSDENSSRQINNVNNLTNNSREWEKQFTQEPNSWKKKNIHVHHNSNIDDFNDGVSTFNSPSNQSDEWKSTVTFAFSSASEQLNNLHFVSLHSTEKEKVPMNNEKRISTPKLKKFELESRKTSHSINNEWIGKSSLSIDPDDDFTAKKSKNKQNNNSEIIGNNRHSRSDVKVPNHQLLPSNTSNNRCIFDKLTKLTQKKLIAINTTKKLRNQTNVNSNDAIESKEKIKSGNSINNQTISRDLSNATYGWKKEKKSSHNNLINNIRENDYFRNRMKSSISGFMNNEPNTIAEQLYENRSIYCNFNSVSSNNYNDSRTIPHCSNSSSITHQQNFTPLPTTTTTTTITTTTNNTNSQRDDNKKFSLSATPVQSPFGNHSNYSIISNNSYCNSDHDVHQNNDEYEKTEMLHSNDSSDNYVNYSTQKILRSISDVNINDLLFPSNKLSDNSVQQQTEEYSKDSQVYHQITNQNETNQKNHHHSNHKEDDLTMKNCSSINNIYPVSSLAVSVKSCKSVIINRSKEKDNFQHLNKSNNQLNVEDLKKARSRWQKVKNSVFSRSESFQFRFTSVNPVVAYYAHEVGRRAKGRSMKYKNFQRQNSRSSDISVVDSNNKPPNKRSLSRILSNSTTSTRLQYRTPVAGMQDDRPDDLMQSSNNCTLLNENIFYEQDEEVDDIPQLLNQQHDQNSRLKYSSSLHTDLSHHKLNTELMESPSLTVNSDVCANNWRSIIGQESNVSVFELVNLQIRLGELVNLPNFPNNNFLQHERIENDQSSLYLNPIFSGELILADVQDLCHKSKEKVKEKNVKMNHMDHLLRTLDENGELIWAEDWDELFAVSAEEKKTMSPNLMKLQHYIWELCTFELSYIVQLEMFIKLYYNTVLMLKNESLLNDIEPSRLFGNIREIFICHLNFWRYHLLKFIRISKTKKQFDLPHLSTIFHDFSFRFFPYVEFFSREISCKCYFKQKNEESSEFKSFIVFTEGHPTCQRLNFNDIFIKPIQHLPRYKLLLTQILRLVEDESIKIDLEEKIEKIHEFLNIVQPHAVDESEYYRMNNSLSKLESYDIVSESFGTNHSEEISKIIERDSHLDLGFTILETNQPRRLHHSGSVRILRDTHGAKNLDVNCILFTDIFLITRNFRKNCDKLKIIRPPIHIDRIRWSLSETQPNTLIVWSIGIMGNVDNIFTLSTSQCEEWQTKLMEAQKEYEKTKENCTRCIAMKNGYDMYMRRIEYEIKKAKHLTSDEHKKLMKRSTNSSDQKPSTSNEMKEEKNYFDRNSDQRNNKLTRPKYLPVICGPDDVEPSENGKNGKNVQRQLQNDKRYHTADSLHGVKEQNRRTEIQNHVNSNNINLPSESKDTKINHIDEPPSSSGIPLQDANTIAALLKRQSLNTHDKQLQQQKGKMNKDCPPSITSINDGNPSLRSFKSSSGVSSNSSLLITVDDSNNLMEESSQTNKMNSQKAMKFRRHNDRIVHLLTTEDNNDATEV